MADTKVSTMASLPCIVSHKQSAALAKQRVQHQ
jgi:hypothetical protein